MTTARQTTATILFTDLVDSTPLWQRAGEARAQQIVQAHHRMLRDAVAEHGGDEVKSTGDGLMAAFASVSAAVRCAVAMQQSARRPAAGERLRIRVGLHTGEVSEERGDYFGTAVSLASRLCGAATGGQIITSVTVQVLLAGHDEFVFRDLGALPIKGMNAPVAAVEILYEHDPLAMLTVTPFVGRDDVISRLTEKFEDARGGRGSLVMLVGEPGIGKTRAAEEFCDRARGSGATVLWGRCYEGDWAPPFSPFSEAIKQFATSASDAELRAALPTDAGVLARIAPALKERAPDLPEPPEIPPDGERYRLLEAVSSLFAAVASSRPLVLVLDDLHWADNGTIAVLRYIARDAKGQGMLVLGTYRDVELDRRHPLAAALADLRRETSFERIALKGLSGDAVGELLGVIGKQGVPEALVDAIASETGGNPFFVREVLLHLAEEGRAVCEDGSWNSSLSIAEMGIPEGVREVIGRRLSRLGETSNRMLTAASAMTGGFSWHEIRAITEQEDDALLDALDEALASQLLLETAPSAYDFPHALIRHTLYEELSTPRRVMLHRRIGEALERLYAADIAPHLAELAHHFFESAPGGDLSKAIDYCARAGDRAMELAAFDEAAGHYGRALEAMEQQAAPDDERRYDVLMARAEAQFRGGDWVGCEDAARGAVDVARKLGPRERLAQAVLRLPFADTDATAELHRGLLEEALEAMGPEDSALRARLLSRRSADLAFHGRRTSLDGEAVAVARRIGDDATLAVALNGRAMELWAPADLEQRLATAREARDYAERAGDRAATLTAECAVLRALLETGDIAGADAGIEAHGRIANETHQWMHMTHTIGLRAMRATLDGRFDEAEQLAGEALASSQRVGFPAALREFTSRTTAIQRLRGHMGEMAPLLLPLAEDEADPAAAAAFRTHLALAYKETGREPEARALFERFASEDFAGVPYAFWLVVMARLADVCAYLGDALRAARLYELLAPFATHCVTLPGSAGVCDGSASRVLGLLAATMSRWDDAARHFEDALAMNTRMGARPWVALTQLDYARMLLKRDDAGDAGRTRVLLEAALATAREIEMEKVAADCESMLAGAG